ncbi:hypothetical protein CAPTEDRAFT_44497, partial [Capitella teleta]
FRRMREAGELIDIILVFGNKEVPCHKVILAGTCEYFKKIFLTSPNVSTRIPITGVNAQTGIAIVDYLYSGYIDITTDNAKDLLQASKLFSLVGLIQIIETMLCDKLRPHFATQSFSSTDNCYSYDSRKKAWTTLPPMTVTRQQHGSTHHQGAILIAGGTDGNGNGLYCKSVERFDLGTNQWSILPPLPHGVLVPSVVSLSNRLFVLGGHLGKSYSGAIYEFDFKRNVWLARASMPDESWCASAVAFDEYVYVINGFSYKNLRYDIHQDSWEEIQAPMFDHCVSPAVVWKGKIHTLGGHKEEEKNTMEVLDPQT